MKLFDCRESFGYIGAKWSDGPSDDPKYLRKRAMQVSISLQCGELSFFSFFLKKKSTVVAHWNRVTSRSDG